VLHLVAGPVNAETLLREAKWVVETTKKAMEDAKGDGGKFKAFFRKAHAERLQKEHGLTVEPITYDPPADDSDSVLTYRDPSGRPLAPKLAPPPLDGPDVTFRSALELQVAEGKAAGARPLLDRAGRRWVLGNEGRVHMILAAHSMNKIETLYATIFEGILGEKISTKPVEVVTPFPWLKRQGGDK
jgi:hypothetical protein